MAAIITAQAGNWSSASTWTGGIIPGNGDTVILNHNVILTSNTIIGTSPNTTGFGSSQTVDALKANTDVEFFIANNVTLISRGDICLYDSVLDMGNGARIEFDTSLAANTTGTVYVLETFAATPSKNCHIRCRGTVNNNCFIGASSNTHIARITSGEKIQGSQQWSSGVIVADYTTFYRLGNSSTPLMTDKINMEPGGITVYPIYNHCLFDTCGKFQHTNSISGYSSAVFQYSTFRNSQGDFSYQNFVGAALDDPDYVPLVRKLIHNVFDKSFSLTDESNSVEIHDNIIIGAPSIWSGNIEIVNSFVFASAINKAIGSTIENSFFLNDNQYYAMLDLNYSDASSSVTNVKNSIFERVNNEQWGRCININSVPTGTNTKNNNPMYFEGNIVLPNNNGHSSGPLFSIGNFGTGLTNGFEIFATNNTIKCGTGNGGFAFENNGNGFVDAVMSIKDNICWDSGAHSGSYAVRGYLVFEDMIKTSSIDYNVFLSLSDGSSTYNGISETVNGINEMVFSDEIPFPQVHGSTGNPGFVDATRTILTWDTLNGGPGTYQNAIAEMSKKNLTTFNPNYSLSNLMNYIREGFRPTNETMKLMSSVGSYPGAVPFLVEVNHSPNLFTFFFF
jgi:hypothetical protein